MVHYLHSDKVLEGLHLVFVELPKFKAKNLAFGLAGFVKFSPMIWRSEDKPGGFIGVARIWLVCFGRGAARLPKSS